MRDCHAVADLNCHAVAGMVEESAWSEYKDSPDKKQESSGRVRLEWRLGSGDKGHHKSHKQSMNSCDGDM